MHIGIRDTEKHMHRFGGRLQRVCNDPGELLEFCLTFTGLRLVTCIAPETVFALKMRFTHAFSPTIHKIFPFLLSKHRHTDTTTVTLNTIQTPLNVYTTTTNTSEHTHTHTPLNTATPQYPSSSSHLHTQPQTHQQQKPTSCITHTTQRNKTHTHKATLANDRYHLPQTPSPDCVCFPRKSIVHRNMKMRPRRCGKLKCSFWRHPGRLQELLRNIEKGWSLSLQRAASSRSFFSLS